MITANGVKRAIGKMALMEYFPAGEDARAALIELIGEMCQSDEEALWLARRVTQLCSKWPGVPILWQIRFCKFAPRNADERRLDRETTCTELFPEGVPADRESAPLQLGDRPVLALPAGAVASADPETDKMVTKTAEALKMPALPKYYARTTDEIRVDAELRQLYRMGDGEVK